MNERVETIDLVLVPVPTGAFNALVSDYIELLGGEPSVIRELVLKGLAEAGLRFMRDGHTAEANRRLALRMGWPAGDEEEMGT